MVGDEIVTSPYSNGSSPRGSRSAPRTRRRPTGLLTRPSGAAVRGLHAARNRAGRAPRARTRSARRRPRDELEFDRPASTRPRPRRPRPRSGRSTPRPDRDPSDGTEAPSDGATEPVRGRRPTRLPHDRAHVVVALVLVTAAIVQTSLVPFLTLSGFRPDLLLLVTIAFALRDGLLPGLRIGFAAGLLVDLLRNQSPVGPDGAGVRRGGLRDRDRASLPGARVVDRAGDPVGHGHAPRRGGVRAAGLGDGRGPDRASAWSCRRRWSRRSTRCCSRRSSSASSGASPSSSRWSTAGSHDLRTLRP